MVVPPKHPKMIIFCRKTHGCWVPPFQETPIYLPGAALGKESEVKGAMIHLQGCASRADRDKVGWNGAPIHPWRLTWNMSSWRFGGSFSFSRSAAWSNDFIHFIRAVDPLAEEWGYEVGDLGIQWREWRLESIFFVLLRVWDGDWKGWK